MTPLKPTNTTACPGAPLLLRAVCNAPPLCQREKVYLPPSMSHPASQHIRNAAAIVEDDSALLPRALFAKRPTHGARMVRTALGMNNKQEVIFSVHAAKMSPDVWLDIEDDV